MISQLKWAKRSIGIFFFFILLGFATLGYSRYIEPNLLVAKTVKIEKSGNTKQGRVVFFSDTHFGQLYDQKKIEEVVAKINEQEPDLVLFGGDFLDNFSRDRFLLDLNYLSKQLSNIQASYGKYAVFGNHDYGGGAVRVYEEVMNAGGFTVLDNESEWIEGLGLRLVGYDDYLMGDTDQTLYQLKSEEFNLILSHEPDIVDWISTKNESFMIAGHSHGGQVSLPFLTRKILPPGAMTYIKGVYEGVGLNKNINLYVSKGIGVTVQPYRLFNIPEVVTLEFRKNDSIPDYSN